MEIDLEHVFKYHAPSPDQQVIYAKLRSAAKEYAAAVQDLVPDCADRSAAIRHIRESLMTANAAVSLDGKL